jgi:hypothetical protein
VELYTCPPQNTTVICADELGPVIPHLPAYSRPGGGSR